MDLPSRIDAILEFLASDGGSYSVKEVSTALHLPLDTCETIAGFLVKYDFAQLEDTKLKIDQKMRAFISATVKDPLLQATPSR